MTDPNDKASGGSAEYDQPATQAERRAQLRNERVVRDGYIGGRPATSTYFQEEGLADDEVGGRYSQRSFDPWPALPEDSPWRADPVGLEPPYGDRVDWLPDQITVSGEDQRGLTPWEYGPKPTEIHAAYELDPNTAPGASATGDPNTNAEGLLTSASTAQNPEQRSTASVERCAVVPSPKAPQPSTKIDRRI